VNYYAYYIVNHHLDFLLEQSADRQRVAMLFPEPALRARIASAATGLRRFLGPVIVGGPVLPTLENSPDRA
jgi:hypothetical protein